MRGLLRGWWLVVTAVALVADQAGAQSPPAGIQFGLTQSKDTVTVGEPFEVRLRVRAPRGSRIRFPENPDTAGTVQALDPRTIVTTDSVNAVDQTAIYRLAAWDVGEQPIVIGNVTVGVVDAPAAGERPVTLSALGVFVRSVLPADSALRVPKPARPLWEDRPFPWWLLALLLGLIGAGLLAWWWWRRRARPPQAQPVDPYDRARRELNRIEAMGLLDAGERTRYAALVVEVLRDYLALRYPEAGLALTSRELLAALRRQTAVPLEQLGRVLHEADLAKFANWMLTEDRARALGREARAVIEHEHLASQPAPDAARDAAPERAA